MWAKRKECDLVSSYDITSFYPKGKDVVLYICLIEVLMTKYNQNVTECSLKGSDVTSFSHKRSNMILYIGLIAVLMTKYY